MSGGGVERTQPRDTGRRTHVPLLRAGRDRALLADEVAILTRRAGGGHTRVTDVRAAPGPVSGPWGRAPVSRWSTRPAGTTSRTRVNTLSGPSIGPRQGVR
ncbi:hypothetical protein GCM10010129_78660 [Streptomyces fumigatiscleroticus]|nr:hypothetical protein GCM10010129_78660 [Streptomyces fumigatiscleroticus]